MIGDSWSCVLVSKGMGLLQDDVRTVLKAASCTMHLDKLDRMVVTHDLCNAIVQTEWKVYSIGSRSGVLFRAHVEAQGGECQVNFLLHTKDLEAGAAFIRTLEEKKVVWRRSLQDVPVPALYEFADLRKHRQH